MEKENLQLYLDGIPLRKIAFEKKSSASTIGRQTTRQLKKLPDNFLITKRYCGSFNGYLVFDGKYVHVRGYPRGAAFLWGVDFLTHDIPHCQLAPSENYLACAEYFYRLRELDYPLRLLICDDNDAIIRAVRDVYPAVTVQLCNNHYLENIRRDLNVRSSEHYQHFFLLIEQIFHQHLNLVAYSRTLSAIYKQYSYEPKAVRWIGDMIRRQSLLLAYHQFPRSPNTTNLIEAYNSHLEGRLHSLKGFQSFAGARLWLNGYVLRRRLKTLTDCGGYFKPLNGKCPLQNTLQPDLKLPPIFD